MIWVSHHHKITNFHSLEITQGRGQASKLSSVNSSGDETIVIGVTATPSDQLPKSVISPSFMNHDLAASADATSPTAEDATKSACASSLG